MARKSVTTISVAASGFSGGIISAPPSVGKTASKFSVGAFGDATFTNVVSGPIELKDMVVVVLIEGDITPPAIQTVQSFTFTTTYSDGTNEATRTETLSCFIQKAEPAIIEIDGNRVSTLTFTLTPVGGRAKS